MKMNIYHGDINYNIIISDIINKNNTRKNISQKRTGILKCECLLGMNENYL